MTDDSKICTFCGKTTAQIRKMVTSETGAMICDGCVSASAALMAKHRRRTVFVSEIEVADEEHCSIRCKFMIKYPDIQCSACGPLRVTPLGPVRSNDCITAEMRFPWVMDRLPNKLFDAPRCERRNDQSNPITASAVMDALKAKLP